MLDWKDHGRGLCSIRPHDLFIQFSGPVLLPLREHHGVGNLQPMLVGSGGELGLSEEGGQVGRVHGVGDLGGIQRARLFNRVLQDKPGGISSRRFVARRRVVLGLILLCELGAGGPDLRLEL